MENLLNELKEKINNYEGEKSKGKDLKENNSSVEKIKNEILELEQKIKEINANMENKSKIEQMKMTLNLTSLESSIQLKKMELEEAKEKTKEEYENNVSAYNNNLENLKIELQDFIMESEEKIMTEISNEESDLDIKLSGDLLDVKKYYLNIISVENKNLSDTNKKLNENKNKLNELQQNYDYEKSMENSYWDASFEYAKKDRTDFWGNWDEDKSDSYDESMEYYEKLAKEKGEVVRKIGREIESLEKEKNKLEILKKSSEDKISLIDNMVLEMLKEVLKVKLEENSIVIPVEIKNENIHFFME